MSNWNEYCEKVKEFKHHKLMEELEKIDLVNKNAIELGCGSGRDTVYLLEHGYNVLGIDRENTEKIIREKLSIEQNRNFNFLQSAFEDLNELPKSRCDNFKFCTTILQSNIF